VFIFVKYAGNYFKYAATSHIRMCMIPVSLCETFLTHLLITKICNLKYYWHFELDIGIVCLAPSTRLWKIGVDVWSWDAYSYFA